MKMKAMLALALFAALPFSAQAEDTKLSYTWLEADYLNLDHGTDGWGLRGQVGFGTSGLYGLGGYNRVKADDGLGGDVTVKGSELGLGYHHSVADKTDLIGELAYQHADADVATAHGMRGSVGVRSAMSSKFEGIAKVNYYDAGDYTGDVTGTVGAQFKFNPNWGITGETEFGHGDQAWMLGVRASF
jgi:Ax21 family sulfation-dependent quorum factor